MPGSSGERERAWYLFRRRRDRRRDSDPPWAAGSPASWDGAGAGDFLTGRAMWVGTRERRRDAALGDDVVETARGYWAWLLG